MLAVRVDVVGGCLVRLPWGSVDMLCAAQLHGDGEQKFSYLKVGEVKCGIIASVMKGGVSSFCAVYLLDLEELETRALADVKQRVASLVFIKF